MLNAICRVAVTSSQEPLYKEVYFFKYFLATLLSLNGIQLDTKLSNIVSRGIWTEIPWYYFIATILGVNGLGHLDPSLPLPTAQRRILSFFTYMLMAWVFSCVPMRKSQVQDILSGNLAFKVLYQEESKNYRRKVFFNVFGGFM